MAPQSLTSSLYSQIPITKRNPIQYHVPQTKRTPFASQSCMLAYGYAEGVVIVKHLVFRCLRFANALTSIAGAGRQSATK